MFDFSPVNTYLGVFSSRTACRLMLGMDTAILMAFPTYKKIDLDHVTWIFNPHKQFCSFSL